MNRKVIIKAEDLHKETLSFLAEIGADMPIDWSTGALTQVKNAVIEAFGKMGVTLEVDERSQSPLSSLATMKRAPSKRLFLGAVECRRTDFGAGRNTLLPQAHVSSNTHLRNNTHHHIHKGNCRKQDHSLGYRQHP